MYIILNYSLSLITLINQKIIHQSLCVSLTPRGIRAKYFQQ